MKKNYKTYHVKNFYNGEEKLEQIVVGVQDGLIKKIKNQGYESKNAFDIIVPTFIDLQVYGCEGRLFSEFPDMKTLEIMENFHRENGTYFFQPTIASLSNETIYKSIEAIKKYKNKYPESGCVGLHVEGPWFNFKKKGAHKEEYIHSPTEEEVDKLVEMSKGIISMITLAPEIVKKSLMEKLVSEGIILSVGHSECSYKLANKLFGKVVSSATHLFNAMPKIHHRKPNLTSAILLNDNVYSSIIADGFHVDFELIKIAHKLKKNKLFCITDAVTETNTGPYLHKKTGTFYSNNGVISGSSITMSETFKNLINKVGLSVKDAINMCSIIPSQVVHKLKNKTKLKIGKAARFNVLDNKYNLIRSSYLR